MKHLLFFLLAFTTLSGISQSDQDIRNAFATIQNINEFENLKNKNKDWWINTSEHSIGDLSMNSKMKELMAGKIRTQRDDSGTYLYKVLEVVAKPQFRARYIYLDGSTLNMSEIDYRRKTIINRYKNGADFSDLFEEYNMDENANLGDLGWFGEGVSAAPFEDAIKKHQKDDIFTIDVPENNWYYVCLKTHDNRSSDTMIVGVIKVTE